MRQTRFDRLLAGTILAAAVAAPTFAIAAPRFESALPEPPSINGRVIVHRRQPAPLPPDTRAQAQPREREAAPLPPPARHEIAPPAAAEPEQKAETKPASAPAIDIRGTLDKLLSASDAQISEKLKQLGTSKQLGHHAERPAERRAIETFYAARNFAPLWIHDGRLTAQAKAAITQLKNAADDGLDTADYPVPEFGTINGAAALADGDVRLTVSVLTYVRHLAVGRIAPTRVSAQVEYGDHTPDPDTVLKQLAGTRDAGATIESYNPPEKGFRSLKEKLADLRRGNASADPEPARIPDGPMIRFGKKDPRVPALREKLHVRGRDGDLAYDKALYNAVRSLQYRKGLKPTGLVDNHTIAAINGPKPGDLAARIRANMERWRWLPRELGPTYVMVNIPDYTLKVVHDGRQVWATKIVAGKPQTPTPLLAARMQHVIVNPSWYVPQSIIQNELLPMYASDPQIFDRMGLEVKQGPDGHINVVQPPGAANALGRIKFAFPNKFQVYLHDTPEKKLFAYDKRAFSHGCMRVEDPTKFGEVMLSLAMAGPTPDERQIARMFGQDEKTYNLQKQPMVYLTYQTVFVDDAGKMHVDEDLYGFDARIHSIMHSDERRVADVAPPPDPKRDAATDKSNQEILRRVERREAENPFAFFDKIFR